MAYSAALKKPVRVEVVFDSLDDVVEFLISLGEPSGASDVSSYTKWEPLILGMIEELPKPFTVRDVRLRAVTKNTQPSSSIRYSLKRMLEKGLLASFSSGRYLSNK